MLKKVAILIFIYLLFAAVGTASAQQTSPLLPGKLAIYYGYPSLVNGSGGGDLNVVTEVFNDYALVVFGDGLQDSGHPEHTNTATIISNLKRLPNNTAVYGYIPLGMATGVTIEEIKVRVDAWNAMGVAGIFLDEAGYDYGVSRQRQNDVVDYVHGKGLSVFINAWEPDDVFSDAVTLYNPNGNSTHLGSNDIYLHESFQIILSDYQDATFWANKSDKALTYKNRFGTRMATVTTVSPENPSFNQGKLDYAWWSTLLYGFDFMGWGELFFSALDNNLPYRKRPDVGEIGSAFTSFAVSHNPPLHTRTTTKGMIKVDTDTHMGRFIVDTTGNVYYVAPTGNDSNPGTETQPWQTIQKAANTLTSGDTVYIRAGIYRERVIPQNSGSDSNHYITYAAYSGETVTLDGNGISVPEDEGLIYVAGRNYIRISGLRVINSAYAGILVEHSGHIILEKNYTDNTASSGIGVWGSNNIIIDGNEVERACSNGMQEFLTVAGTDTFEIKNNRVHNGVAEYRKEGIDVKDGASNGQVYRNYVYLIQAVGIYVDAWDKHTFSIDVFQNIVHDVSGTGIALASEQGGLLEHIRVYNNVVYHNKFAGIWLSACCPGVASHPMNNIKIINNTFYNNGWETWGGGIGVENPDIQNVVIRNNIVSQNLYFQIAADASKVTVDHNLIDGFRGTENEIYGEDYVEGNPLFMKPSGADFHLQPNSPAIGRGSSADAPTDDFDGNPRPNPPGSNPDIGAYEHERGVPCKKGDVSGNGNITAYDASIVLQVVVGLIQIGDPKYPCLSMETADVTGNKTISALDAALILQYTVGLITKFPVESAPGAPALNPKDETQVLAEAIAKLENASLTREQKQVLEELKRLVSQKLPPARTALFQNYPNPFNPETWLPYELAADASVVIRIYNAKGQLVRQLNIGVQKAGSYLGKEKATYWDGRNDAGERVSSGIYFYRLQAGSFAAVRKMVVLK